jgi:hypothetical protein
MTIKSIAASWIIALCLLGLISLLKQPTAEVNSTKEPIITIPGESSPQNSVQLTELEAQVWCALDGDQMAQLSFQGKPHSLHGAMAIMPTWKGQALNDSQRNLLASCIDLRLHHLAKLNGNNTNHDNNPAMDYLFTRL